MVVAVEWGEWQAITSMRQDECLGLICLIYRTDSTLNLM